MEAIKSVLTATAAPTPEPPAAHPWEARENPQTYDIMSSYGEHPAPRQHVLGVVGGNAVPYQGRVTQVDTESELRGINRALTFCPQRQYKPTDTQKTEVRPSGIKHTAPTKIAHTPLAPSQMWGYPATLAHPTFSIEACVQPEKF